jgi:hypothetical protein
MYTQREMAPGDFFTYRYVGTTSDDFVLHYGFVSASPVTFAVPGAADPFSAATGTGRPLASLAGSKARELGCRPSASAAAAPPPMTLLIADGVPSELFMRCVRLSLMHEGDSPAVDALTRAPADYAEPYSSRNELDALEWMQREVRDAVRAVEEPPAGRASLGAVRREAEESPSSVSRLLCRVRLMYYRNLLGCSDYLRSERARVVHMDAAGSAARQQEWSDAAARKRGREQAKWMRRQMLMSNSWTNQAALGVPEMVGVVGEW